MEKRDAQSEVGKGRNVTETEMGTEIEMRDVEANREVERDMEGEYVGGDKQGYKMLRRLFRWLLW